MLTHNQRIKVLYASLYALVTSAAHLQLVGLLCSHVQLQC
jgi:hypothetical protein